MFGKRLTELRKKRGLSQYKLAELLQLTRGQIANYEQGKRQPDFDILKIFADFFSVSTDYFLGRTPDPTPPKPKQQKPEYEKYVTSAPTLAEGLRRVSETIGKYHIDFNESTRLSDMVFEKFKDQDEAATLEEIAGINEKTQDNNKDDTNGESKY